MNDKKRMAGDYEIIHAMHIGDQEIVVGEDPAAAPGQMYMCAFCEQNEILARYDEVLCNDDYVEIIGIYGQRVTAQAEKTRIELKGPNIQGIFNAPITSAGCTTITSDDDLNGKVVVIKPEILRREYRRATNQVMLCDGGFGASPNSRGSACYCVNLYTGKTSRFERRDILGVLKNDQIPKWAQHGLKYHQAERQRKAQHPPER
ncbi:MAG: hypothetical protein IKT52_07910 [Oscillospiraceae bacterium]|nr:hypothetical protein [Oscillospiraceae bacterium]